MTPAQTIQIRLSTCRQTLNELLQVETRSAEQQTEMEALTKEVSAKEPELRAALAAEIPANETRVSGDAETREFAQLTERANVGDILSATFEKRNTSGAAAELQQHYGIGSHQVPLEMLRIDRGVEDPRRGDGPGEHRRRLTSRGHHSGIRFRRRRVFGYRAAHGASRRRSLPGAVHHASREGSVHRFDRSGPDGCKLRCEQLVSPERLQASFSYRRTDAARFAGLDASLRLALNGGLQEKLDQQAIEGTDGLLTGTNLPNNNVSTATTFALYLSGLLYGRVDGRYARTPGDVRMIVGQGTFTHAASTYKGNNSDESGVERLQEKSGGLMVSAHIPAVSGNKQNALMRLGQERGGAVQPMWQGVSLVVDEFTRAAFGEVVVHAILLANFAITRKAQFHKQQTQHA